MDQHTESDSDLRVRVEAVSKNEGLSHSCLSSNVSSQDQGSRRGPYGSSPWSRYRCQEAEEAYDNKNVATHADKIDKTLICQWGRMGGLMPSRMHSRLHLSSRGTFRPRNASTLPLLLQQGHSSFVRQRKQDGGFILRFTCMAIHISWTCACYRTLLEDSYVWDGLTGQLLLQPQHPGSLPV